MSTPATLFVSTIVIKDGKALMIQEGKNNFGQRGKWNFPAGRVELGETFAEAAVRETKEESGYDVKIDGIITILKDDFKDGMGLIIFFLGSLVSNTPGEHEEGIQDVKFVPIDEIPDMDLRFSFMRDVVKKALGGVSYPLEILTRGES